MKHITNVEIQKRLTLSGYRIMWMMAIFDLPTLTKLERSRASKFRKFLLDEGFSMMQLSVYVRSTAGMQYCEVITKRVGNAVPKLGKVELLYFTDKQFGNIVSFRGVKDDPMPKKLEQLCLF